MSDIYVLEKPGRVVFPIRTAGITCNCCAHNTSVRKMTAVYSNTFPRSSLLAGWLLHRRRGSKYWL